MAQFWSSDKKWHFFKNVSIPDLNNTRGFSVDENGLSSKLPKRLKTKVFLTVVMKPFQKLIYIHFTHFIRVKALMQCHKYFNL